MNSSGSVWSHEDLLFGFAREIINRQDECDIKQRGFAIFHVRVSKKDFFDFAEHQKRATFEFGSKCTNKKKFWETSVFSKSCYSKWGISYKMY